MVLKSLIKLIFVVVVAFVLGLAAGIYIDKTAINFSGNGAPTCLDGTRPDKNGCCAGEVYTDMGDVGWNCCPESGGHCFPPIQ